jgi:AraC family cel operon transcriptional repressor
MKHRILEEKWHIDFPEGFKCRFITSETENKVLHQHEYYEIFLTLSEDITHHINNKTEILKKGTLTFIRPDDVHVYTHSKKPYTFINLAFSKELANSIFSCLGNNFPMNAFLTMEFPPSVVLSESDTHSLKALLHEINMLDFNNSKQKSLYCKMILITIFAKYFSHYISNSQDTCPEWLNEVCNLMAQKKYFSEGINAMVRLSGKSYEHLSRSIKKYKNVTLSGFVNNIRLNHAANLLKYTNLSITDIAIECGYNNVSYFPTCFKKKYGLSPKTFRQKD